MLYPGVRVSKWPIEPHVPGFQHRLSRPNAVPYARSASRVRSFVFLQAGHSKTLGSVYQVIFIMANQIYISELTLDRYFIGDL